MPKYTAAITVEIMAESITGARHDIESIMSEEINERYANVTAKMNYWQVNKEITEEIPQEADDDPSGINDHSTYA